MSDRHLLLVNPPEAATRPEAGNTGTLYIPGNQIVRCINPGILSIATHIHSKGYEVEIVDLLESASLDPLTKVLTHQQPWVIGISCSHGFNYLSTLECARHARTLSPDSLIVVGGQHAGPLGKMVLAECEEIDVVVKYEGELPTEKLVSHFSRWGRKKPPSHIPGIVFRDQDGKIKENSELPEFLDLNEMPFLEFELYPNFRRFNPYVEESRGCFFGCNYCLANHMNLSQIRVKRSDRFLAELRNTIKLYGQEPLYPILASTFGTQVGNTLEIIEGMRDLGIQWTTELRVDGAWPRYINSMYNSGFRIATIGLESASPEILLRMNKTKHPEKYILQAQELINKSANYEDLLLKFNIIFYIGETPLTVRSTLSFLLPNAENLAAVRFSPLFGFPGTPFLDNFDDYSKRFGASLIDTGFWSQTHIYPINVSNYFSFEECASFSNTLEKLFTDSEVYFKANQYTYGLEDVDGIKEKVTRARIFSDQE